MAGDGAFALPRTRLVNKECRDVARRYSCCARSLSDSEGTAGLELLYRLNPKPRHHRVIEIGGQLFAARPLMPGRFALFLFDE